MGGCTDGATTGDEVKVVGVAVVAGVGTGTGAGVGIK